MASEGHWARVASLATGNDLDRIACVVLATAVVDDVLKQDENDKRDLSVKIRGRKGPNGRFPPHPIRDGANRAVTTRNDLLHGRLVPDATGTGNCVRALIRFLEAVIPQYPDAIATTADKVLNRARVAGKDALEYEAGRIRCSSANFSTLEDVARNNISGASNDLRVSAILVAGTLLEHALHEVIGDFDYRRFNLGEQLKDVRTWHHLAPAMEQPLWDAVNLRNPCAHSNTAVAQEEATKAITTFRAGFAELEIKFIQAMAEAENQGPRTSRSTVSQPPPPAPPEFRIEVIRPRPPQEAPATMPRSPAPVPPQACPLDVIRPKAVPVPEEPGDAAGAGRPSARELARQAALDSSEDPVAKTEHDLPTKADVGGFWTHVLAFGAGVAFGSAAEQQASQRWTRNPPDQDGPRQGSMPVGGAPPHYGQRRGPSHGAEELRTKASQESDDGSTPFIAAAIVAVLLVGGVVLLARGSLASLSFSLKTQSTGDIVNAPPLNSSPAREDDASEMRLTTVYQRDPGATLCGYVVQLASYGNNKIEEDAWRADAEFWRAHLASMRPAHGGVFRFYKDGPPAIGLRLLTEGERTKFMKEHRGGIVLKRGTKLIKVALILPGDRDETWNGRVCFRSVQQE